MKSIKDVMTAVVAGLEESFPDIPVESEDVDQNTGNPCFYAQIRGIRDGSPDLIHDYGTVTIYYFPEDVHDCEIELLNVQIALGNLFWPVLRLSEEFVIPVNELDFDTADNVLVTTFEFEMWQEPDPEEEIMMEQLEVK